MSNAITLHPEYGVNPSLEICFWCGAAMGVALLGRNRGKQAPPRVVTSYTPCPTCKANMDQGITLMEVTEASLRPDNFEIQKGIVPTGRWMVLAEASIAGLFKAELAEAALQHRKVFLEKDVFQLILPPAEGEVPS